MKKLSSIRKRINSLFVAIVLVFSVVATASCTVGTKKDAIDNDTNTSTTQKIDMSGVSFNNQTYTYDGTSKSIWLTYSELPKGISKVNYTGNGKVNVGIYTVTASFVVDAGYEGVDDMTATMTIVSSPEKPAYDMSQVKFDATSKVYTGSAQTFALINLPVGVTAKYTCNGVTNSGAFTATNAGTYNVTVKLTGSSDYQAIADITATLKIATASVNTNNITFANKTVKYDGTAKTIKVGGVIPSQVESITYTCNGKEFTSATEVGTYVVTATYVCTNRNYTLTTVSKTATLTITDGGELLTVDMSGVSFNDKSVKYDGTAQSIELEGTLPEGIKNVTYTGNGKTAVGTYTVTASFEVENGYEQVAPITATLTIYDSITVVSLDKVSFKDASFDYDGTAKSITATNIPTGVEVAYVGNGQTAAGTYTVTATFTTLAGYEFATGTTTTMSATLTINDVTPPDPVKTIYVDASSVSWSQAYCYMWTSITASTADENSKWPGAAMTNEGDGIWSYEYEEDYENVIFNDGMSSGLEVIGTNKTDDLTNQGSGYIYSMSTLSWDKFVSANLPKVSATVASGSSFTEDTLNVSFTITNATSITYTVDGGNANNYKSGSSITIGAGVEYGTTITIVINATNADGTTTKSFTYKKVEEVETSLATNVQEGQILQCFNWSFDEIKNNMSLIAEQGFSAVQTSPVQATKEDTAGKTVAQGGGSWWVYYQPISYSITNGENNNALGTRADLIEMCEEAHKYGIKVIVDAVMNHCANSSAKVIHSNVVDYIKNNMHDYSIDTTEWYNGRYDITQHNMPDGLPDINTGSQTIQDKAVEFAEDCVACGVDGFRFDGAKHIETTADSTYGCGSDFWDEMVGAAKDKYAKVGYFRDETDFYCYGEILDRVGAGSNSQTIVNAYAKHMSMTTNMVSNEIVGSINGGNASGAARSDFAYDDSSAPAANKAVLWNESHDTYINWSRSYSSTVLNKAWAMVGARAQACGMYLARPQSESQLLGVGYVDNNGWASQTVKAVNVFNNSFIGQSEYIASEGNIAYNERGTTGVVLVNCSGTSSSVSVTAHKMASGTYTDAITGNTFTVSNGKISGNIGSTGVAVVYATSGIVSGGTGSTGSTGDTSSTGSTGSTDTTQNVTVYFTNNRSWSNVYCYSWSGSTKYLGEWPGTAMTYVRTNSYGQAIYSISIPAGSNFIFNDGSGNQTVDLSGATNNAGYYISGGSSNAYTVGTWTYEG